MKRNKAGFTMTMTKKRPAGPAQVGRNAAETGEEALVQSKRQAATANTGDGDDHPSLAHRISSLSSSSRSCSLEPSSQTIIPLGSSNDDPVASSLRRLTRLQNARILRQDGSLPWGSLTMDPQTGLIVNVVIGHEDDRGNNCHGNGDSVEDVDCNGHIISPGFIDIQLNGAYGVDFSNDCNGDGGGRGLETRDIVYVAQNLVQTGVTSFCPTMISSSPQTYRRVLPMMRQARIQQQQQKLKTNRCEIPSGAKILGMHLEGPFFAKSKRGAHNHQHIVNPTHGIQSVRETYGFDGEGDNDTLLNEVDIITLAPELSGSLETIRALKKQNVAVSCGHTEATFEDGLRALSSGSTLLTHLFNAMNPFHHRKPGLIGLLSADAQLARCGQKKPFYSMIVDGIHVHESAVCLAYNSHRQGCVLVTDAMTAMGLADGDHLLGNMKVTKKGDRATLSGTETLAGSVVSMDSCVKRFRQFTGCSVGDALTCATLHPATVLGKHSVAEKNASAPIGILEANASADIVLVNDDIEVLKTFVGGQLAYQNPNLPCL